MNRASPESDSSHSAPGNQDNRMGLAPVFAAALGVACCLALPVLVGLFAGGTSAAALSGGPGLIALFIIGFALAGVLVVALHYVRASRRGVDESSQGETRQRGESESSR